MSEVHNARNRTARVQHAATRTARKWPITRTSSMFRSISRRPIKGSVRTLNDGVRVHALGDYLIPGLRGGMLPETTQLDETADYHPSPIMPRRIPVQNRTRRSQHTAMNQNLQYKPTRESIAADVERNASVRMMLLQLLLPSVHLDKDSISRHRRRAPNRREQGLHQNDVAASCAASTHRQQVGMKGRSNRRRRMPVSE